MKSEEVMTFMAIVLLLFSAFAMGFLNNKNKLLEEENQNLKDNLGYHEGTYKPVLDYVNITCKIPREVIEKNWIYQIYVIEGNTTCSNDALSLGDEK